jgi:hypothetical protein
MRLYFSNYNSSTLINSSKHTENRRFIFKKVVEPKANIVYNLLRLLNGGRNIMYQMEVKQAIETGETLQLPEQFQVDQLVDYMNDGGQENILIIYDLLDQVTSLTATGRFKKEPITLQAKDFKGLKEYKDWAELIILCVSPSANMDDNRSLYKGLYRALKKHGQLIAYVTLADEVHKESFTIDEYAYHNLLQTQKYHGIALLERADWPHQIIDQVEYREFILTAFKGKEGTCYEEGHAVIYKGPFKEVTDDGGHTLIRGKRMAVCEKTYNLLTTGPYKNCIIGLEPYYKSVDEPVLFDCTIDVERSAKQTKGLL